MASLKRPKKFMVKKGLTVLLGSGCKHVRKDLKASKTGDSVIVVS